MAHARTTIDAGAIAGILVAAFRRDAQPAPVAAERNTLAALEAGCSAPVAAYAEVAEGDDGPELFLRASVTSIDGSDAVRGSATGPLSGAAALGRELAAELLDRGAAALMAVRA